MLNTYFAAFALLLHFGGDVVANIVLHYDAPSYHLHTKTVCHDINHFLVEAAQFLVDPKDHKLIFVIGNDGCDLDSTNGAIAYAYHLTQKNKYVDKKKIAYIPIVNIDLADWDLKRDVAHHIETTMQIELQNLEHFFLDQIKTNYPERLESAEFVLVDHFQSTDPDLIKNEKVIHIIDHHTVNAQWKTIMAHLKVTDYTIEATRSCATLILRQIKKDLKNHPNILHYESGHGHQINTHCRPYDGVFELLLAPMLADNDIKLIEGTATNNLEDRKMFIYMFDQLQLVPNDKRVNQESDHRTIHDSLGITVIGELLQYKKTLKLLEINIDGFEDKGKLCKKDMKVIWTPDRMKRVCVPQIQIFAQEYMENMGENAMDELKKYANDKNCHVIVIMGRRQHRDVAFISMDEKYIDLMHRIRNSIAIESEKKHITLDGMAGHIDFITELPVQFNRKTMLPLIQTILDKEDTTK